MGGDALMVIEAGPATGIPATGTTQAPAAVPAFEIVPAKGLPIVGAALLALVAAIVSNKLWALEFFHVAGGGLWTGVDLFVGLILGPIIGRMSVPARIEFSTRFMPKMLLLMP